MFCEVLGRDENFWGGLRILFLIETNFYFFTNIDVQAWTAKASCSLVHVETLVISVPSRRSEFPEAYSFFFLIGFNFPQQQKKKKHESKIEKLFFLLLLL